ncbi:hypothetical protein ACIBKX_28790 [Streptomyces sp. NPDC050658]|uniref:hypothetical protein n=1 Tax=unclassified Streptomyces TaxID=2593676 RepID=UPI003420E5DC
MFEYEMHQLHAADLTREADHRRLLREARASRTTRRSAREETEGRVISTPRRSRFTRAA